MAKKKAKKKRGRILSVEKEQKKKLVSEPPKEFMMDEVDVLKIQNANLIQENIRVRIEELKKDLMRAQAQRSEVINGIYQKHGVEAEDDVEYALNLKTGHARLVEKAKDENKE